MIEIKHLQKAINHSIVIDLENLSVTAGEVTAVVGLTGQTKTTFIELCMGKTQPTAGTIRLAGVDPHQNRSTFAQKVGVLLAINGLYLKLSSLRNLIFYCDLYGLPHSRANTVLQQVGLQDQANVQAGELSSGLARRLAFGRAILHQPSVLLLVDPFIECDPASVSLLERLIHDIVAAPTAVLIVSNDRAQILSLSHTVVEVENGQISQQYRPEERETQSDLPFKIPAKLEGKVAFVNPSDILYAMAEDGRTFLCTDNGRVPTHLSLTEVETRLARSGFFRAHRSYLVNLQHIKEVIAYTRNSYTLILDNETSEARMEIPLSKGAARELRDLLDY